MFRHVHIVPWQYFAAGSVQDVFYVLAIPFMYIGEPIVEEYDSLTEALERAGELEPHLQARVAKAHSAIRSTRLS